MSSGKKTKHIKTKFFFIKDRVDDGEIKVTDCPTEEMWADIMTKPLQGTAFRVMRVELMNCPVNYKDPPEDDSVVPIASPKMVTWKSVVVTAFKTPQECVGQNENIEVKRTIDRQSGRTIFPLGTETRRIGAARLQGATWKNAGVQQRERMQ